MVKSVKSRNMILAVGAIEIITFAAFAFWILVGRNSDTLYQAQNFSFFSNTATFFSECMQRPGGLLSWAASFLSQLFYKPALGATVMIALWLASLVVSKFALRVPWKWTGFLLIPMFALLTSMVDNGYWLYFIKQQGFWFYATVGYLAAMLMTLVATVGAELLPCRMRVAYRVIVLLLISFTYPLFGVYTLAALAYSTAVLIVSALSAQSSTNSQHYQCQKTQSSVRQRLTATLLPCLCAIAFGLVVPRIAYNYYANIRLEDIYSVGLPCFCNETVVSATPFYPFCILLAAPVVLAFIAPLRLPSIISHPLNLAVVALCAFLTEGADFQDYNYHAEIRMYKAMENHQWDEVLREMAYLKEAPNRQMILTKNIALINKGNIGNEMFAYRNDSRTPQNGFDTLQVHMAQTAASLIYLHHGRTHFAYRWSVENMVEYGKSFNNLKILAQCALVNGETDLAKKYLTMLKTSIYYKEWAEHYWAITENPALIKNYHEFDTIRELNRSFSSILDSDAGLCEVYLLHTFSSSMSKDSKLYHELTLVYAMVQQDIQLFWPRFFQYAEMHKGEEMPIHYQEAAYLYGNLEKSVDISGMPFDKAKVIDRYEAFHQATQQYLAQGMSEADIAELTYPQFGDTFYWFYFFCRNLSSY